MPNEIETLIREAAPRVTRQPEAFLAALSVSDEAAEALRLTAGKRRRVGWTVGAAAAVVALGGTGVAVAASQSVWWSAPHQVIAEAVPVSDTVIPAKTASCILEADFALGVDGGSAEANATFQLAQQWLVGHPVVVAVPENAQTLTLDEEQEFVEQGWPAQIALNFKAIRATQGTIDASAAAGHDALVADLSAYLTGQGANPALLIVADHGGYCEVGH